MTIISVLIILAGAILWLQGVFHFNFGCIIYGLLVMVFGAGCLFSSVLARVLS